MARASASDCMAQKRKCDFLMCQQKGEASLLFYERKTRFTLVPMDHRLVARLLQARIPKRVGAPRKGDVTPTVAGLARACGIAHTAVSQWVSGKTIPEVHRLKGISEYLQIPYQLLHHALEVDLGVERGEEMTSPAPVGPDSLGERLDSMSGVEKLCALIGDLLEAQATDSRERREFREDMQQFMIEMRRQREAHSDPLRVPLGRHRRPRPTNVS
jgi:transcriptional regulator with XRE-family HTH domain